MAPTDRVTSERSAVWLALAACLCATWAACAYSARPEVGPTPQHFMDAWSLNPLIAIPLLLAAVLYVRGVARLWRFGRGRGVRTWEVVCFGAGWCILALSLLSPLHPLGEVLFWAHMVQHELIMVVAAPLLVLGRPIVPWLHALPMRDRLLAGHASHSPGVRRAWRMLSAPSVAFIVQATALWGWHAPRLYDAALRSETVHALEHATFIGASLLFWWSMVSARRSASRSGKAVLYLFLTAVHSTLLGALLATANTPWYVPYVGRSAEWGISAMDDQQLAGLIMWIPACVSYLAAALALAAQWLREPKPRVRRTDRVAVASSIAAVLVACVLFGCSGGIDDRGAAAITHGGNAERGQKLIPTYGCGTCHAIPGIEDANGQVGPPLAGIGQRSFIGGVLANTPDNMIRWLRDPPAVDSLTAMPNMGISEHDARDIAAYLYTLK